MKPPFARPNKDDVEVYLSGFQISHRADGMLTVQFDRVPSEAGAYVRAKLVMSAADVVTFADTLKREAAAAPTSKLRN